MDLAKVGRFCFTSFSVMKYSGMLLPLAFVALLSCTSQTTPAPGTDPAATPSSSPMPAGPDTTAIGQTPPAPVDTLPHSEITPATDIRYSYFRYKDSGRARMGDYSPEEKKVIYALNRIDGSHIASVDTVVFPEKFPTDLREISPFPQAVPALRDVKKIVLFSYPIQAFAAYKNGVLEAWGPTSMGRKNKKTPEGLYFANWKAKETISTVSDEWKLKWNFNIQNRQGIGWHQYGLPGKPASHSCLRLLEADAKWLYDWADMWILKNDQEVNAQGTPTIVFGEYPWGGRRPWLHLIDDPHANDLSVAEVENIVEPHLQKILEAQKTRESFVSNSGN